MKQTVVRGEIGALQLLHHATLALCDVREFAPFTHFGTRASFVV